MMAMETTAVMAATTFNGIVRVQKITCLHVYQDEIDDGDHESSQKQTLLKLDVEWKRSRGGQWVRSGWFGRCITVISIKAMVFIFVSMVVLTTRKGITIFESIMDCP